MTKTLNVIKRFAADEEGTALMEYTVLLGMMVVAVIGIVAVIGPWVTARWAALCTGISSSGIGTITCP